MATSTIGQGNTRSIGLRWICPHDGTIYQAVIRLKRPLRRQSLLHAAARCMKRAVLVPDGSLAYPDCSAVKYLQPRF